MKMPLRDVKFKRRGYTSEVRRIQATLASMGQQRPVVLDQNDVPCFNDGHETCQAAKNLGWTEIEVWKRPAPLTWAALAKIIEAMNPDKRNEPVTAETITQDIVSDARWDEGTLKFNDSEPNHGPDYVPDHCK